MPTAEQVHQGARLLYFSFANEFDRILCDSPLWISLLSECNYSRAIYITQQQHLVGICGCYFHKSGFFTFDENRLRQYCPKAPPQILHRLRALCTFAESETFYIEALAIDPYHRRKGLATHLLHCAEQQAKAKGYRRLALDVDLRNVAACQLYQSRGFTIDSPFMQKTVGDSRYLRMIKNI